MKKVLVASLALVILSACASSRDNTKLSGPFPPGTVSPPRIDQTVDQSAVSEAADEEQSSYRWSLNGPRPVGTFSQPKRVRHTRPEPPADTVATSEPDNNNP